MTPASRSARQHRSVRRGVEHLRRRDAHVGAGPGAHRPRPVLDHVTPRRLRLARAPPRRRLPTRSRCHRRQALVARCRRLRRSVTSHAAGLQRSRRSARRGAIARATRARAVTRRCRGRSDRVRRLHGRWCVGAGHRWRRTADRRGRQATPRRPQCRRRLHRAAARPAAHARSRCSAARTSSAASSIASARPRLSALLARPNALPTPAEIDAPGLWVARLELAGD